MKRLIIGLPFVWAGLFLLLPILVVLAIAVATAGPGSPPITPSFTPNLSNFTLLLSDDLYAVAFLNSVQTAAITTLGCAILGYPMAYGVARAPRTWRLILLMLVILPFWTSFLLRVYAWIGLLQNNGLINAALLALGVIEEPLGLIATPFAVQIGMIYTYLPFMILPLYATLERLDPALLEAAADLGCRPWRRFLSITLPLSAPGLGAGALLVFAPAVGEYVILELLGGTDTLMIGSVLWLEFFSNRDWPVASAVAVVLLALMAAPIWLLQRHLAPAPR